MSLSVGVRMPSLHGYREAYLPACLPACLPGCLFLVWGSMADGLPSPVAVSLPLPPPSLPLSGCLYALSLARLLAPYLPACQAGCEMGDWWTSPRPVKRVENKNKIRD
jgi:hypothetical protein